MSNREQRASESATIKCPLLSNSLLNSLSLFLCKATEAYRDHGLGEGEDGVAVQMGPSRPAGTMKGLGCSLGCIEIILSSIDEERDELIELRAAGEGGVRRGGGGGGEGEGGEKKS